MSIYCIMFLSLCLFLSLSPCWLSTAARFTRWRALLPWRKWFWASFQCFGKSLSFCPVSCLHPPYSVCMLLLSFCLSFLQCCCPEEWQQITHVIHKFVFARQGGSIERCCCFALGIRHTRGLKVKISQSLFNSLYQFWPFFFNLSLKVMEVKY